MTDEQLRAFWLRLHDLIDKVPLILKILSSPAVGSVR